MAEYQVNKNYIAEFLCVNKSKPKLRCNGKCQLVKRLQATEEHNENHPSLVKNLPEIQYFCQATSTFLFQYHTVFKTEYPAFSTLKVTAPVFGIFHPPCFLV